MKINLKATGIELTQAISDYVHKKVESLQKYVAGETVAQVEVGRSTKHHKSGEIFFAEVHITAPGLDAYARSEQADIYAAIDLVKDEVAHELTKLKGKREAISRRGAQAIKNMMKGLNPFRKRG